MRSENPIYEAAYQMALLMKNKQMPIDEKIKEMNNKLHDISDQMDEWKPSPEFLTAYAEYHCYLNEALHSLAEEQEGI